MRTRRPYTLNKVITRKHGAIWHISYYDRDGVRRKHSAGESTKAKAHPFGVDLLKENATARSVALKEFTRDFFVWSEYTRIKRQIAKERGSNQQWAAAQRSMLLNHIIPKFSTLRLQQITWPAVERRFMDLGRSNQTRNYILYPLKTVLTEAEAEGHIERNPHEHTEPMGKRYRQKGILIPEGLKRLYPECEVKQIAEFVRVLGT